MPNRPRHRVNVLRSEADYVASLRLISTMTEPEEIREENRTLWREEDKNSRLEKKVGDVKSDLTHAKSNLGTRDARITELKRDLESAHSNLKGERKKAMDDFLESEDFKDLIYEEARPSYKIGFNVVIEYALD
ncbi:hypothetical protein Dimus_005294 [Dionaea muscipula]